MAALKPKREISETERYREHRESLSKRHKKQQKRQHSESNYDEQTEDIEDDLQIEDISLSDSEKHSQSTPMASTSGNAKQQISPLLRAKASAAKKKLRQNGGRDSGTSSEEERWLDAIESGKFEEVDDELKKIKDPKLMTARQRAMYERGTDKEPSPGGEILMSLPTGYKEKVMTAEAIQKKQLKSMKRKQLADEKREKDKKRTMDRLLKKQESKLGRVVKGVKAKSHVPLISYRNNTNGATLSYPAEILEPFQKLEAKPPPKTIFCGVENCKNVKRYNCSKTNVPLCSFECYKINLGSDKVC